MKSVNIRNIDPLVLDALKRSAKANHRSLQGELHAILERAAKSAPADETMGEMELVTVQTQRKGSFTREEMYEDDGR